MITQNDRTPGRRAAGEYLERNRLERERPDFGQRRRAAGADWAEEHRGYTTPCHVWLRSLTTSGYGVTADPDRPGMKRQVHRLRWEAANGPVPAGLELDHLCRVRACCNPDHLEPVTRSENLRRGDVGGKWQRERTHCPAGHPYSGDNVYVNGNHRHCKACRRQRMRDRRAQAGNA